MLGLTKKPWFLASSDFERIDRELLEDGILTGSEIAERTDDQSLFTLLGHITRIPQCYATSPPVCVSTATRDPASTNSVTISTRRLLDECISRKKVCLHIFDDLIEAMSASEIQAERQAAAPRTPSKRVKDPHKPMIGSSSTWGQAELDRFEVKPGDATAKGGIIPEKWFDFGSLENYTERSSRSL